MKEAETNNRAELKVRYDDDPRVARAAATDDYALHVVPKTARSSRWSLAMAYYSLFSAMFFLITAALVALAVGTVNALIGISLAVLAHGFANYILVPYAIRTGTTVNLLSRVLFGNLGSTLAVLIVALTAVFYATFEGSIIAVAFFEYFGGLPLQLWYLVVVLYSVPLVFGGIRVWLDKFNGFLLPFYLIGLIGAVIWTIAAFGYSNEWLTYTPESVQVGGPGWLFAFTIYMGIYILTMYMWDFARYGREEDSRFHSVVTFGPVFYFFTYFVNGVIGIFLALNIPTEGPLTELSGVLGMIALMGLFAVALVWVSQTRINTANFYIASLNFESFFGRVLRLELSRVVWAVVVGVLVYLFMLVDVFDVLLLALQYQAILIVAWVAIAVAHVLWSRLSSDDSANWDWRPGRIQTINWGGIGAWALATLTGILFLELGGAAGAFWSAIATFFVAYIAYTIVLAVQPENWSLLKRPNDPRTEVEDQWETRIRCETCDKYYVANEMDRDPGSNYQPICAACAQSSRSFYGNAKQEAKAAASK